MQPPFIRPSRAAHPAQPFTLVCAPTGTPA